MPVIGEIGFGGACEGKEEGTNPAQEQKFLNLWKWWIKMVNKQETRCTSIHDWIAE